MARNKNERETCSYNYYEKHTKSCWDLGVIAMPGRPFSLLGATCRRDRQNSYRKEKCLETLYIFIPLLSTEGMHHSNCDTLEISSREAIGNRSSASSSSSAIRDLFDATWNKGIHAKFSNMLHLHAFDVVHIPGHCAHPHHAPGCYCCSWVYPADIHTQNVYLKTYKNIQKNGQL